MPWSPCWCCAGWTTSRGRCAKLRRVLRPAARFLVVCCDCHRPTLDSIQEASFTITHLEHMTLPKAPKFVGPAIMGSATTPACRPRRR
jgi:hypothetical protein